MGECLDVDSLSNTTFNDVCVVSNLLQNMTAYGIAQDALNTCCGPDNVFITGPDDCYTYCNITTPYDTVMIDLCLQDTLDDDTSFSLNFDCFPFAWELYSTTYTDAGKIATTWTYPYQTVTFTESDGATSTETLNYLGSTVTVSPGAVVTGTGKTTSLVGSTATKTAESKSTSSTATPTASKSSSHAGSAFRLSYGTGGLVALAVLALVL